MKGLERLWSKTVSALRYSVQYSLIPVILFITGKDTGQRKKQPKMEPELFFEQSEQNLYTYN